MLAEADGTTGAITREYIWLPQGDISPAADNDNEEGASSLPLPLALVTGVNTSPQPLMVHADHLNRPTRLTDAARATVWSASYDPFGQPVSITGPVEQNLRFPGQYFLIETGLSYNWHRFYDPTTGRYTQADPLRFVDEPSVYGYATASPMMRVDPEGLDWVDPMGIYYPDGGKSSLYCGFDFNPLEHPYLTLGMMLAPVAIAVGGEAAAGAVGAAAGRWLFGRGSAATTDFLATRNGIVDVRSTLNRIAAGEKFPHRNDGSMFKNREGLLPRRPPGYHWEYVHPTPGVRGPGTQRVIRGQNGKFYYTPDHCRTFVPLN